MMTFCGYPSYDAYKQAFRAAAARYHVDPVQGASSFQVIHIKADIQVATHVERMRDAVWTNADLPSGWVRYGGIGSRIELMARRDWWMDETFWRGRCEATTKPQGTTVIGELYGLIEPTDVQALEAIRQLIPRSEQKGSEERPLATRPQQPRRKRKVAELAL